MSPAKLSSDVVRVEAIEARAYKIPTDSPEADGTLAWSSDTMVVVEAIAADRRGLGYAYCHASAVRLVRDKLAEVVTGRDAMAPQAANLAMMRSLRNIGWRGLGASAVSAVDVALWDLKARLLEVPLVTLLGPLRDGLEQYGSGGFTSYDIERLRDQLVGWAERGFRHVKMKVGDDPGKDAERVAAVRQALPAPVELFVDANGAYSRKQALFMAELFADHGVRWLEEPVSSDDLEGLRLLRDRGPAGMAIAAGEYVYGPSDAHALLAAGAVDVLQADATRCLGITGLAAVAAACRASHVPLSTHTAPALHLHPGCALEPILHGEYFHDHVRIEQLLFDGVVQPREGKLVPDMTRPGLGLELKRADAERFAI